MFCDPSKVVQSGTGASDLQAVLFVTGDNHKCLYGEQFVPAWGLKQGPAGKQSGVVLGKTPCSYRKPASWPTEEEIETTIDVPCFVLNKLCEAKVINPKPDPKEDAAVEDQPMGSEVDDPDYVPLYELLVPTLPTSHESTNQQSTNQQINKYDNNRLIDDDDS